MKIKSMANHPLSSTALCLGELLLLIIISTPIYPPFFAEFLSHFFFLAETTRPFHPPRQIVQSQSAQRTQPHCHQCFSAKHDCPSQLPRLAGARGTPSGQLGELKPATSESPLSLRAGPARLLRHSKPDYCCPSPGLLSESFGYSKKILKISKSLYLTTKLMILLSARVHWNADGH